ncbi:hypothetical protein D6D01_00425 [Aureobasidium pullulans]|uniref:Uncharacterized protein n=1 Tax=Aureobasidium pullulans TaxID=5580 RepID=A0A4S9M3M8_AURPU|nr:hypothetical protein D6D01_00425 [Aureobasidium pullulans]
MTTLSEDSSQGLDHPCLSTIPTPYPFPQEPVAPSQAEAKTVALSVEQQHKTAKQQRLQQRQEYQIQYYRKLEARRWEEMRLQRNRRESPDAAIEDNLRRNLENQEKDEDAACIRTERQDHETRAKVFQQEKEAEEQAEKAAGERYEREEVVTQQSRFPAMKQTVRMKKHELVENSNMMQNPMQEAMQEQRKVTTQKQRLANMRRRREAKKLQQQEAADQPMNEDANDNRQQLVCLPISWEQFYGQRFKKHIKDCQSGQSNETRTKLLQRIDNEYAEHRQQFYKQQRDDQKKCDEEEGNDISELTKGMKDMSLAQAAEEKVTEVKQDIAEAQAPAQNVADQDGYMDLGEEGTEDGEDWVVNYYGGSDIYSPTMNGDVRTVIQGCPTLWFREVAGYPNHVACMEFNELSAVISRESCQIAVDRVYAADERLRVGDPDRAQYRLLGPLERPEEEGPCKLEVAKVIRPSIEGLPGPSSWLYRPHSKVPRPVRGSNRKSHISKPAECKEKERPFTGLTRRRGSKASNQSRKPLPATPSRRLLSFCNMRWWP